MSGHSQFSGALPRLLYIGDVPVEASYHGSALLYRLLESYPAGKLEIIEAGVLESLPDRRIRNVRYEIARVPLARLQTTRFAPWYTISCLRTAVLRARGLAAKAGARQAEAILTVPHGYSWITAANVARRLGVPLHLICHDLWTMPAAVGNRVEAWKESVFGTHYRAAVSRMCASPFMAQEYERRYGVEGTVLYPSRAAGADAYASPPDRLRADPGLFTCAFAGTINSNGMVAALKLMARALQSVGGRLLIFGPIDANQARTSGLGAANIELGGLLPSARLIDVLRERADVLFVPMSFAADERPNMEMGFPSKLTDYTSVGLPLLVYGPSYCSAVIWATQNDGVAEIVTEESEAALSQALRRIASDPAYRLSLAKQALGIGKRDFSHASAVKLFHDALLSRGEESPRIRPEAESKLVVA